MIEFIEMVTQYTAFWNLLSKNFDGKQYFSEPRWGVYMCEFLGLSIYLSICLSPISDYVSSYGINCWVIEHFSALLYIVLCLPKWDSWFYLHPQFLWLDFKIFINLIEVEDLLSSCFTVHFLLAVIIFHALIGH